MPPSFQPFPPDAQGREHPLCFLYSLFADCTDSLSCRYILLILTPSPMRLFTHVLNNSPVQSNSGCENHRLPCVFECISSENLVSLLNENSAMRRNQFLTTKNVITTSICKSLTVFTISPKAKSHSFMNRSWFGLLGDCPPSILRDILSRLCSHCCNHPRSHPVGESPLPAHYALANASLILKTIHAGHPDFLPENITIANTCPCCGSCFLTAEEVILN